MNVLTPIVVEAELDPRYVFLTRAATRLWLVDNLEMSLDEALSGLVDGMVSACDRELVARWERIYPAPRLRKGGRHDRQCDA
jgi:hypothetical protein